MTAAELYGVDWVPGIANISNQKTGAALYQSMLYGPLPIDDPVKGRLLAAFDTLGKEGQLEAIKRIKELAQLPAYQTIQPPRGQDPTHPRPSQPESACRTPSPCTARTDAGTASGGGPASIMDMGIPKIPGNERI